MLRRVGKLLRMGVPVFIHDSESRENEVDMIFYAPMVTAGSVAAMRRDAGGLICYAMPREVGEQLGLRYMDEILRDVGYGPIAGRVLRYGDPPNFSLWVNHVGVATGIRDEDRALTIRELDRVASLVLGGRVGDAREAFYREFTSPGHVPILLGRGLSRRRGHTELSLALAELAGLRPSVVVAEVLSDGGAMSVSDAERLARVYGSILIEGDEIVSMWDRAGGRGSGYYSG